MEDIIKVDCPQCKTEMDSYMGIDPGGCGSNWCNGTTCNCASSLNKIKLFLCKKCDYTETENQAYFRLNKITS